MWGIPTISYSRYITLSILTDVYSLKIRAGELLPTSPTPPRHIFVFIPQFSSSTDCIPFLLMSQTSKAQPFSSSAGFSIKMNSFLRPSHFIT